MLELISANNFSKYNQQQTKITEHMGKGGTVSQGEERGKWKERATGGRRRGEVMRNEKGRELEPVSYVSEHQDRQPRRAPGNEARGGPAPLRPCPQRERRATGSNEHSARRMQRLLLWATRFYKLTSTCNVLHLQIFILFLTFQITQ